MELVAQGIGFIAVIVSFIVFQTNNRKTMLRLKILDSFLFSIHFYLLGALTGSMLNAVNVVRNFTYSTELGKKKIWLYIFIPTFIAVALLTWQGPISLLPMMAMCIGTYSFWLQDTRKIRNYIFIGELGWLGYNIAVFSIPGIMIDIFILTSVIIGKLRFDRDPLT